MLNSGPAAATCKTGSNQAERWADFGVNMRDESSKALKVTAITVADAAKVLASAYGRHVTEEQVREVATRGDLVRADGTMNLLEYVAYLAREVAHGTGND